MTSEKIVTKFYLKAVEGLKDEWLVSETTDWYNYILSLPKRERFTYMIMIMHEQVFNGGFHQYFANAYGRFAFETIPALKEIGAIQQAKLLEQALNTVNEENYSAEVFREKIIAKNLNSLFSSDEVAEKLEDLAGEYIDLDGVDIFQLLGSFLTSDTL